MKAIRVDLGSGYSALIDQCDERALDLPWRLHRGKDGHLYASVRRQIDGKRECLLLHRYLMKPAIGQVVDHINNDGLDNRRCNLRVCTPADNLHNRLGWRNAKVPYKGVTVRGKRYIASIMNRGVVHRLGSFATAEEAAAAYNEAATRLHGEFAKINSHGLFFNGLSLSTPLKKVAKG